MELAGLVPLDALVHVIGDIGAQKIICTAHQNPGHIHGHIAASYHRHLFGIQGPLPTRCRVSVIPFHEVGGTVYVIQAVPLDLQRTVVHGTSGEEDHVIAVPQVIKGDITAEFHIRIKVDIGVIQRLFQGPGDVLDAGVVRRHTVSDQAEGNRQLFEEVDAGTAAKPELVTLLLELTKKNVRGVDPGRAGTHDCNTQLPIGYVAGRRG